MGGLTLSEEQIGDRVRRRCGESKEGREGELELICIKNSEYSKYRLSDLGVFFFKLSDKAKEMHT